MVLGLINVAPFQPALALRLSPSPLRLKVYFNQAVQKSFLGKITPDYSCCINVYYHPSAVLDGYPHSINTNLASLGENSSVLV